MATAVETRPTATRRVAPEDATRLFTEFAETRDPDLRELLVRSYAGLAASLASRFAARHEAPEDVQQVALLGLLHAIDRFDPHRGIQFTTFAWATISGELKRHFRDRTWGMRVPRRVQELYLETAEATDALTHRLGRSPTIAEIAEYVGASDEAVIEALEARSAHHVGSLDESVGNDDDMTAADRLLGTDEPGYGYVEERVELAHLVDRLPARERMILRLRFGSDLTQAEIAKRVGVSQMHVSRLLASSLAKLRAWASEGLPPGP